MNREKNGGADMRRTDLAMEERELWQQSAGYTTQLPGVKARETAGKGITTTWVEILDDRGVKALHKPIGNYITLELERNVLRTPEGFSRAACRLGRVLSGMLPDGQALVVGLGNNAVTPDAIGPRALEHLLITRHMGRSFPTLRPVSAIAPGVLGTTGLESVEVVRGIVERAEPACVVVLDALASRNPDRVCKTLQLTDTGIVPGSGVGNSRSAFNSETLGVPVFAVGVPTVVEAATYVHDALERHGCEGISAEPGGSMVLIPRDIDAQVTRMARLLGFGVSLALHKGMTVEDISCFVG